MPLTSQQTQWIVNIDSKVTTLLANGVDEETLLVEMRVLGASVRKYTVVGGHRNVRGTFIKN